jgi:putative transposase
MDWARILAYVTGTVEQELLARNEYLAAENRILKAQLNGRVNLSDAERVTLAEIGHRLGRKALAHVATVAKPDTILAWYRKLVAGKFDGSKARRGPGRPRVSREKRNGSPVSPENYVAARKRIIATRSPGPRAQNISPDAT